MIAIISDIHGNYVALQEVLKEIDILKINEIYCLGDVVGYYHQVNEVCHELQERDIECILGNHDWYMISDTFCPRSNSVNKCMEYQRGIITEDNIKWLRSFPTCIKIGNLSMVHGGWNNPIDEYLFQIKSDYFVNNPNQFFASGHTHRQTMLNFDGKIYCNPGSVGQPRDGNPQAAFATFDGNNFKLHRVDYNIDEVCRIMEEHGFGKYFYKRLHTGAPNFFE